MDAQCLEEKPKASVPHLHVCNQSRSDTDWSKTHTVLPDTVRVHLREIRKIIRFRDPERKQFYTNELKKKSFLSQPVIEPLNQI